MTCGDNPSFIGDLPTAVNGQIKVYPISFAAQATNGQTIVSATAAIDTLVYSPLQDPNAANLVLGSPSVSGLIVSVYCGGLGTNGFQPGGIYGLYVTAVMSDGEVLVSYGIIACDPLVPPLTSGGVPIPIPIAEYDISANFTPAFPGIYRILTPGLTMTIPAGFIGGTIIIVDGTNQGAPSPPVNPNLTIIGSALNMPSDFSPLVAPDFTFTLSWYALGSGYLIL